MHIAVTNPDANPPQLVDYDRHNNSLNKLREKKEKSLNDERNLFKVKYYVQ
jgi:hypothetical protein